MTVIQTVAGGAGGGGGGEPIDISGELYNIRPTWTSSTNTYYTLTAYLSYNNKKVDVVAGDNVICKTLMAFCARSIAIKQTVSLSSIVSDIQTVLNGSESGLSNLPDGSYTLYIGHDVYGSDSGAYLRVGTSSNCRFAEVNITMSGGVVTVVSTNGTAYATSTSSSAIFRIAIYGIIKTA